MMAILIFSAGAARGVPRFYGRLVRPSNDKVRIARNHYVDTLLHSNDVTEITRAGIIVHEVPCNLWQRLNR